jgi:hypothetical protein
MPVLSDYVLANVNSVDKRVVPVSGFIHRQLAETRVAHVGHFFVSLMYESQAFAVHDFSQ